MGKLIFSVHHEVRCLNAKNLKKQEIWKRFLGKGQSLQAWEQPWSTGVERISGININSGPKLLVWLWIGGFSCGPAGRRSHLAVGWIPSTNRSPAESPWIRHLHPRSSFIIYVQLSKKQLIKWLKYKTQTNYKLLPRLKAMLPTRM